MKKLLLLILICLTACISDVFNGGPDNIEVQKFNLMDTTTVKVDSNNITIALLDSDTIYAGNVPVNIEIPSYKQVSYLISSDTKSEHDKIIFKYEKEGIVIFEDVIDGDNDYNDFVAEVEIDILRIGSLMYIELEIDPIALGNSIPLGFGIDIHIQDKEHTIGGHYVNENINIPIYKDIRKEAFFNKEGFINTTGKYIKSSKKFVITKIYNNFFMNFNTIYIVTSYYIDINTSLGSRREYAINYIHNKVKEDGRPYGLFVPDDDFEYPKEGVSIFRAYPNFQNWVNTRHGNPFKKPNKDLLYNR